MIEYKLLIKTNSYAGNFERELCAFVVGAIGDCGVGEELVNNNVKDRFKSYITNRPDEHGCYRPVELDNDSNNLIIHLATKLETKDIEFIHNRARLFELERPYEYLNRDFKYLGLELLERETIINNKILYNYENK